MLIMCEFFKYSFSRCYLAINKKQEAGTQQLHKCLGFAFTLPKEGENASKLCERRGHFKEQKGETNLPGIWSFLSFSFWGRAEFWEIKAVEGKAIRRELSVHMVLVGTPRGAPFSRKNLEQRPDSSFLWPPSASCLSSWTVPHPSASGSFQSFPEPQYQKKWEADRQYNLMGPRCPGSGSAFLLITFYSLAV